MKGFWDNVIVSGFGFEHQKKRIFPKRFVLNFCDIKPVRIKRFYFVRKSLEKDRTKKILEKSEKMGKKLK